MCVFPLLKTPVRSSSFVEYLNRTASFLLRHLEQVLLEVERHLEAHKRAAMGGEEEEEDEGKRRAREDGDNQRVITAVHSLTLHLQAALMK